MALAQSDSASRPRLVCPRGCPAGLFIFSTFRRFAWRNHPAPLRPARRTSNYEGGGIGARSVGTCRKDFSVTFWQRWSEESHLPSRRFEGRADVDLCLFATRSRPRTIDTLALGLRLPTTLALEIRGPGFGNIYAVRGTDTQPSPSDRL